jgi:hypothetical protein
MSQNTRIIRHLKKHKTITPMQALRLCGCMRLAARISNLREAGWRIETKMVKRAGKRYARYTLIDNESTAA